MQTVDILLCAVMATDKYSDTATREQAIRIREAGVPSGGQPRDQPNGRVRSLEEARRALWIPKNSDPEVLRAWGTPTGPVGQLAVYPVEDAEAPGRVAEFALLRVVKREGNKLVASARGTRLRLAEKSNALWIVYGSLAFATDGSLVIESLAVGPAFEDQLSREGDDNAPGITSQLLRLLSPPRILAACAEHLIAQGHMLDDAATADPDISPTSRKQTDLLGRIDEGRPQRAQVGDDQLAQFAARYVTLYYRGVPQLRLQLAREFGLTTTQVRDRTNRARRRGYLTPGSRGRAGANPGPRLLERGWQPELTRSTLSDETTDQKPDKTQYGSKTAPQALLALPKLPRNAKKKTPSPASFDGRYWARTSDPQLVELVLSQLS